MTFRTIIVGILALICGVAATIGIYRLNNISASPAKASVDTKPVVVARMAVEYGKQLQADHVQVVNWPAEFVPEGGFSKAEQAIGHYCTSDFAAKEPIIMAKLSMEPTYLQLPSGMRAVTIQTTKESSLVAGLIAAGNRVDVILTITKEDKLLGGPTTITLLENIEVLAVGQDTKKPGGEIDPKRDARSVTLMVTPEFAEELNLAAAIGTLNLSLRGFDDENTEPRRKISLHQLFTDQQEAERKTQEEKEPSEFVKSLATEFSSFKKIVQEMMAKAAAAQAAAEELKEKEQQHAQEQKFVIPAGYRAVSIMTPTDASGVAGLIQPGDHVDVILTADGARLGKEKVTTTTLTLLEKVQILAVGSKVETDENGTQVRLERSVTLLVTPEIAQDLNLASEVGTLSLALRGEEDDEIAGPLQTVNLAELLTKSSEVPIAVNAEDSEFSAPRRQSSTSKVRVLVGGNSEDLTFHHRPVSKQSREDKDAN